MQRWLPHAPSRRPRNRGRVVTVRVTGLVLAAGSSRRLGQPKQLLPFGSATLLDATIDLLRSGPFAQRLVTIGGSAPEVREGVNFDSVEVVDNLHFTDGCSSSIVSALSQVDESSAGIVMLLGDQPGVDIAAIETLISAAVSAPLAVCRYADGRGHPFWFGREVFSDLALLHGDKAVWKLIESGTYPVLDVPIDTNIPLDVDTWDDYERLLTSVGQTVEQHT